MICDHRHRYQRERWAAKERTKGEVCPDDEESAPIHIGKNDFHLIGLDGRFGSFADVEGGPP